MSDTLFPNKKDSLCPNNSESTLPYTPFDDEVEEEKKQVQGMKVS